MYPRGSATRVSDTCARVRGTEVPFWGWCIFYLRVVVHVGGVGSFSSVLSFAEGFGEDLIRLPA